MLNSLLSAPIARVFGFLVACWCWLGVARAQDSNHVTPSLIADTTAVAPGEPFTVGVRLKMLPGWHVYYQFSGDSGAPPKIDWELPAGYQAGPIQWPLPTAHFDEGDLLTYIYEGEILLPVQITPPAKLEAGEVTLKANLKWLVCEKICVPGEGLVELKMRTDGEPQPANGDAFSAARGQLPKTSAPPFTVKWDRSKAEEFSLRIEGLAKDVQAEFFPLPPEGAKPAHPKVSAIGDDGARTITFPIEQGGAPNLAWRGVLAASKDGAPRESWLLDSGPATPATGGKSDAATPAERNLFGLLWSAFLGGLILNLMPCVLPVIALKIFGFVQQAGEEPKRVFRLGLAFVGGVFAFFMALAALIVGLKAAGINLTWGFQFQHVGIFVGLISLVFIFGLNLLGVFEIALAGGAASRLGELSSKEGYSGAFLHGMFTTLLGTSCTAPFLGAVLGFAFVAPPHIVVLLFAAIAAGMSLPYFLLTANPAWMRFLPKPGLWMERLKQVMGFIMLAVVVWLLGVLGQSRGVEPLIAVSGFLLVLGVAAWLYGVARGKAVGWVLILALVVGGWFFLLRGKLDVSKPAGGNAASLAGGIPWQAWSEERVIEATKSGQAVFVDFTADWCLNCKYNEKFVLETDPVRAALKDKKVLPLKADWTNADPAITAVLKQNGRVGVPVYLLYPGGNAAPVLLPEILSQSGLLEALGKIGP